MNFKSHQNILMLFETQQKFIGKQRRVLIHYIFKIWFIWSSTNFFSATSMNNRNNPHQFVSLGPRLPNPVFYSEGLTPFAINCPIASLLMGVSWYFCTHLRLSSDILAEGFRI